MARNADRERFGSANLTAYHNEKTLNWKAGWDAHRHFQAAAPRFTWDRQGFSDNTRKWKKLHPEDKHKKILNRYQENGVWQVVHGFRDTYVDIKARSTTQVPGSGAHRTCREFIQWAKDDVNDNWNRKESTPHWTTPKQPRATSESRLHSNPRAGKKPSSFLTPGPGAYTQYSSFGMPSGGLRRTSFFGHSDMRKTFG